MLENCDDDHFPLLPAWICKGFIYLYGLYKLHVLGRLRTMRQTNLRSSKLPPVERDVLGDFLNESLGVQESVAGFLYRKHEAATSAAVMQELAKRVTSESSSSYETPLAGNSGKAQVLTRTQKMECAVRNRTSTHTAAAHSAAAFCPLSRLTRSRYWGAGSLSTSSGSSSNSTRIRRSSSRSKSATCSSRSRCSTSDQRRVTPRDPLLLRCR